MFAGMRSKKKSRDSPGAAGAACAKTDQQQQQQHSKRKDVVPEALKLPSPLNYYPGTQMPMDGWFHACRLCRCWTAFSATATTGEVVPLCRRCLPSAARKGQTAPKVASQQHLSSSNSSSAATAAAAATNTPSKANLPAAAPHRSINKSTDTPTKVNHPWGSSYANLHQQQQQYHQQQAQQPQPQQQRVQQRPQPGQAKSTTIYKAGSRVFKSANNEPHGYVAPSQAAAAAATAAMAHAAAPAPVPSAPPMPHPQQSYSRTSSNSIPDRRSSTGDGQYVSAACYKHLGPTNMHTAAAPADAYITCLGSGSTDNGSSSGSREQSASDMLGAITSLLSDLYNMRFSGSSGSASSSNGGSAGEVDSRSNSMSKKQAAATAAAAAAAENLRNLPI